MSKLTTQAKAMQTIAISVMPIQELTSFIRSNVFRSLAVCYYVQLELWILRLNKKSTVADICCQSVDDELDYVDIILI